MIKLLILKIPLVLVSIFTLTYASIQTENLGHLNLQPGFAVKLYTSSLRGPDDYRRRPQYFKEKDFLKDSQLIAQNVIDMEIGAFWEPYINNNLFGFAVDPTITNFVVEMRGYIKAPLTGNLSISIDINSGFVCHEAMPSVYEAGYWIVKDSISLNGTSDGFICSYNSSDVNYKALIFEENCTSYQSCFDGGPSFHTVTTIIKDQYYPVVFYTYISGNYFLNDWALAYGDGSWGEFGNSVYYDPNDDFEAEDVNLNSGFPDACPHFHEEVFTATSFVTMSRTDDYDCPTQTPPSILASSSSSILASSSSSILPPSSSSILPSSTSSILPSSTSSILPSSTSSAIQPSSSGSSNSVSHSSSEQGSVATSSSTVSSSGSKISSASPSSSISSITGTSSMNNSQSSRSGT
ncbi:hypothetical protein C6P45_003890, partial [Maudiozyma exigua]